MLVSLNGNCCKCEEMIVFSYLIAGSLCCLASLCLSLMGLLFGGQTKVLRKNCWEQG